MKNLKKFLAVFLSVCLTLSCVAVFADEVVTDEEILDEAIGEAVSEAIDEVIAVQTGLLFDVPADARYYDAVRSLNSMDVIKGYEDGSFKPDQNVTRAEFTAMLMRLLSLDGLGSKSAAGLPFTDIDDNNPDYNWAIPNINTAYAQKIINGYDDGTFRPMADVAYEEAVKMIMCTLGYVMPVDCDPWYQEYIKVAGQKGVTKVAKSLGQVETPASRACIAQLLYDSLDVQMVENEKVSSKTILSDYMGKSQCVGVIYSNDDTSLESSDVNLRDDEIMIYARETSSSNYELHTYKISDTSLKSKIGYEVEFYYEDKGNGVRTLTNCVVKGDEPVVVDAGNIETQNSTDTEIKYYPTRDADKAKTLRLESNNKVIYNGKLYGQTADSSRFSLDMIPTIGQIRFIDSDGNDRFDVVDITAYEVYYVSSKSSSTYEIVDNVIRPSDDNKLKLDVNTDNALKIVNKSGDKLDFSSISTGNIICYVTSHDNGGARIKKAIVLKDSISGSVSGINDDKYTIGGKEYYVSNAAPWLNGGKLEAPVMQDSGTFYLDLNGDIVAYTKNTTSSNQYYGFIIAYNDNSKSFDSEEITFKIINSSGSVVLLKGKKGTSVNKRSCSNGEEVLNALQEALNNGEEGSKSVQQLIKYTTKTVSGETVLDKIYTATEVEKGGEIVSDQLTKYAGINKDTPVEYNTGTKKAGNISLSGATAFIVPDDGNQDDFKKTTVSNALSKTQEYKLEAFEISATNVAKFVVVYGIDTSKQITDTTFINIITEMSSAVKDDEPMVKIKGYSSSSGTVKRDFDAWVSNKSDNKDGICVGDIIRCGTDKDGDSLIMKDDAKNTQYIYKFDEDNTERYGLFDNNVKKTGKDCKVNSNSYFVTILGSVVAVDADGGQISIIPKEMHQGDEYSDAEQAEIQIFDINTFKNAQIVKYDTTGKKLEITQIESEDYEAAITGLNALNDGVEPSKVLVFISRNNKRLFVILPD